MRQLVEDLQALEEKLRLGGGSKKIEKQHRDGKLTARERIAQLLDNLVSNAIKFTPRGGLSTSIFARCPERPSDPPVTRKRRGTRS